MATNVRLDEDDGTFLLLDARVVKSVGTDFILDSPGRRKVGGGFRRALTHNQNDGLDINHNGDYPGGVKIAGATEIVGGLAVRGNISYQSQGISEVGKGTVTITVNLEAALADLRVQIIRLEARVAALEARPHS